MLSSPAAGAHPGLLSGLDVFVGGPIQHALRGATLDGGLTERLTSVISAVQDHGGNVFSAHVAERFGQKTASFTPDQVSLRDYRWMTKCDVFVPVLPCTGDGGLLRSDGTHIELGWASAGGTPIVMVIDLPIPDSASHLLKGLAMVGSVRVVDLAQVPHEHGPLIESIAAVTSSRRELIRQLDSDRLAV